MDVRALGLYPRRSASSLRVSSSFKRARWDTCTSSKRAYRHSYAHSASHSSITWHGTAGKHKRPPSFGTYVSKPDNNSTCKLIESLPCASFWSSEALRVQDAVFTKTPSAVSTTLFPPATPEDQAACVNDTGCAQIADALPHLSIGITPFLRR